MSRLNMQVLLAVLPAHILGYRLTCDTLKRQLVLRRLNVCSIKLVCMDRQLASVQLANVQYQHVEQHEQFE